MADQYAGQEGVGVDPNLAIFTNRANLHADFVRMADDHQLEHIIAAWVGIQHHARIAFKLVQMPVAGSEALEVGLQHAVGHRAFQANRAGGRQNIAHQFELRVGHRLRPGFCSIAHRAYSLMTVVKRES